MRIFLDICQTMSIFAPYIRHAECMTGYNRTKIIKKEDMKKLLALVALLMAGAFSLSAQTADTVADEYVTTPWEARRVMVAHFENAEVEISDENVTPMDYTDEPFVTFEWVRRGGAFEVGQSHKRKPGKKEVTHIVIHPSGTDNAFPMIRVGEEGTFPEVTIHIKKSYLFIELKGEDVARHYFYNIDTHVLSLSDEKSFQGRVVPADADRSWSEIVGEQLSPKAE